MTSMFLCAFTEDGTMPDSCPDRAMDYFRVSDKVCVLLVEGAAPTPRDVCGIIGIGGEKDKHTGIAVGISSYSGYEDKTLWEKMRAWVRS